MASDPRAPAGQRYLVPAAAGFAELEVSRSRFLAHVLPVREEAQARDAVAELRAAHHGARHHTSAFLLGPGGAVRRSSDDGEPSGTAGAPMLEALSGAGLSDVLAVVVRYFGGVLLGTGGLARAYRGAVTAAIECTPTAWRCERAVLTITLDYATAHTLEREAAAAGWTTTATFGERVDLELSVPPPEREFALARLAALTAQPALELGTRWVDVPAPGLLRL